MDDSLPLMQLSIVRLGGPLVVAMFFIAAGLTVIRRADRRSGTATAAAGALILLRSVLGVAETILITRSIAEGELGSRGVLAFSTVWASVSWSLTALGVGLAMFAAIRMARAIRRTDRVEATP